MGRKRAIKKPEGINTDVLGNVWNKDAVEAQKMRAAHECEARAKRAAYDEAAPCDKDAAFRNLCNAVAASLLASLESRLYDVHAGIKGIGAILERLDKARNDPDAVRDIARLLDSEFDDLSRDVARLRDEIVEVPSSAMELFE